MGGCTSKPHDVDEAEPNASDHRIPNANSQLDRKSKSNVSGYGGGGYQSRENSRNRKEKSAFSNEKPHARSISEHDLARSKGSAANASFHSLNNKPKDKKKQQGLKYGGAENSKISPRVGPARSVRDLDLIILASCLI